MSTPPLRILQQNATELFERILQKHGSRMNCQKGCTRCCETRFSVFSGEAELIWNHVLSLPEETRQVLSAAWDENLTHQPNSCAFLSKGECTVYEARPIICRTQGAPLCLENERAKTRTVTACELNFTEPPGIPTEPSDWFQLNRLTELQSIAEREVRRTGGPSSSLKSLQDREGRVGLAELAERLVQANSARLSG